MTVKAVSPINELAVAYNENDAYDMFSASFQETFSSIEPVHTDISCEIPDIGFHLEHPKAQIVNPTSNRTMNGTPKEFLSEIVQNTKDAGGKRIKLTLDEVPLEVVRKTGLIDLYKKLDEDYEYSDVKEKKTRQKFHEIISGDMISYLAIADNGKGLDGDFKYMFADPDTMANDEDYLRHMKKYKPGGAHNFFKTDGSQSKEGPSAGSHNTGGKTAIEGASKILTAFEYSRRACDDLRIFAGHTRNGIQTYKKYQKTTAPRSMFHKANGDLVNGKEADALAKMLNIYRNSGESGLTAVVLEPKDEFKSFETLLVSTLEAMQLHIGVYRFEIEIADMLNGKHIVINKNNYLDLVAHVLSDEFQVKLAKTHSKTLMSYINSLLKNLEAYSAPLWDIFQNSNITDSVYVLSDGTDPLTPAFSDEAKAMMKEKLANGEVIAIKQKVLTKRFSHEEVVSDMFTLIKSANVRESRSFFDRDGICLSFSGGKFSNKFVSFTHFVRSADGEPGISDFLRDCENINHDAWDPNPQVKAIYEVVNKTIEQVKYGPREIVKYLSKEDSSDVDMSFFDRFFPQPSIGNWGGKQEAIVPKVVQDSETQAEIRSVRGQKSSIREKMPVIFNQLVQVRKKPHYTGFIVEPSLEPLEGKEIKALSIRLAFKELGLINNHRYSRTSIRNNFTFEGLDPDTIQLNDKGNELIIMNPPKDGFSIDITNPDMMRIPELSLTIQE